MNIFEASITLLLVAVLGITNVITLPRSFGYFKAMWIKVVLGSFCVLAVLDGIFLARAGFVSDTHGIGGNDVAPLYGTEWYILIIIAAACLLFQIQMYMRAQAVVETEKS